MEQSDRRSADRVEFTVTAAINAEGKQVRSSSTENLSLTGVFVVSEEEMQPGTSCDVTLEVTGRTSVLRIEMEGRVARAEPGRGFGIEFTSIDLDSYTFLKYVVEYNRATSPEGNPKDIGSTD